jgi:hypothetical protein
MLTDFVCEVLHLRGQQKHVWRHLFKLSAIKWENENKIDRVVIRVSGV